MQCWSKLEAILSLRSIRATADTENTKSVEWLQKLATCLQNRLVLFLSMGKSVLSGKFPNKLTNYAVNFCVDSFMHIEYVPQYVRHVLGLPMASSRPLWRILP